MTSSPSWTDGLGEYYEGVVGNVSAVLELHKQDTLSTFGIRRSESSVPNGEDKENKVHY
jgi:hypothetical protein